MFLYLSLAVLLTIKHNKLTPPPDYNTLLARCERAYDKIKTLDVDATARSGTEIRTAHISFLRPGHLRVTGTTGIGPSNRYDLIFNGELRSVYVGGHWSGDNLEAESAIATLTGISRHMASTLPALIFHLKWSHIGINASDSKVMVSAEKVHGQDSYRIHEYGTRPQDLWIDKASYLLIRTHFGIGSNSSEVEYTGYKINRSISASRFSK